MPEVRLSVAAYSVQNAKPTQKYGQITPLPVYQGAQDILLRVSLAGIPKGATITSAALQFVQGAGVSGTHSLTLYRVTGAWPSSVTWSTLPSFTGTGAVTVSKSSPAAGTLWSWGLTSFVQAMVTGTNLNIGFLIAKNQTSRVTLLGTPASSGKPVLVVQYTLTPSTPTNLHPSSGAVSVAKPSLTFNTDDDVVSIQVQIDAAADAVSPDFDSGEVAATAGLLDLNDTAYGGLSNGASTSWRARQKNGAGWSTWSSWATFSRTNKSSLTIDEPTSGTVSDGTPPTEWTFGGTQTAWQVRLLDASGRVLSDSGRQNGTATSYNPSKGLTTNGQTGTLQVRVWDDVDREATPGDPAYTETNLALTLTLDGSVDPVDSLTAVQTDASPVVTLTGTRNEIPDYVQVFINGTRVATYAGLDVFDGDDFTIQDVSAPMNQEATYRVAAVVNGAVASGGPTATLTPKTSGIWLIDESDHDDKVVLWRNGPQNQSAPELSIVHTPIGDDDEAEVVRRRLVRFKPQGDVAGTILDARGFTAAASEALLNAWTEYDAGHLFRLVMGNLNRTVIIGDLTLAEPPATNDQQRVVDVTFNWWSQS